MNVNDTVSAILKSWPSLYSSRLDALIRIFTSSEFEWINGELVSHDEQYAGRALTDVLDIKEETKLTNELDALRANSKTKSWEIEHAISSLIDTKRENSQRSFTWNNAELLAKCSGKFRSNPSLYSTNHLDLPENVTEDWRDAAKELAEEILRHKFITHPQYIASYDEAEMNRFELAKKVAQKFLDTFDPKKVAAEKEARIANLRKEAEALGFVLAEKPV